MNIIIITGGSKGLGKALVEKYMEQGYEVYSLARTPQKETNSFFSIEIDLSNLTKTIPVFRNLLEKCIKKNPNSITLLNNAGTLGKIDTLAKIPLENIESSVTLNYTSPLILCSLFVNILSGFKGTKKIRNISSGAANGSYHGWSVYCSTKSALDSFSKTLAVEERSSASPVHVISIYPGIIDTGMQAQIRTSTESEFSEVQRFKDLKKNNELSSPQEIAESIYLIDTSNQIESGEIVDVRNF